MRRRNSHLVLESLERRVVLTTFFVNAGESIQAAIDAAATSAGPDTVIIRSGDYQENLVINDADSLTIRGIGDVAIQDSSGGDDDVIEIERADGGLTIQNVNVLGGDRGIDANDESSLASLSLLMVTTDGTDSDGIRIEDAGTSSVRITHSSFDNGSDGMDLSDIDSIQLIQTSANGNSGQGLEVDDSGSVQVVGGEFVDNEEGLEIDGAESARIVDGLFAGNEDEGLDIDDVGDISVINVISHDNGGNGLQVEATDSDTQISSVRIVASKFDNNGDDGVQVVVESGEIAQITLIGNASTDNTNAAFNIDPLVGDINAHANHAAGNGNNTLPS